MLRVFGLTKSFGSRTVLDNVDLEMSAGERVALLGANGSGKTTTLRCIAGLARPDAGTILVGGRDLAREAIAARGLISYLPQTSVFPPTLTVRETLDVVARLRRVDLRAVDRELEACGLERLAGAGVGRLSGGERQRLAMAIAFLPAVDLYLFDEPSASLDPVASRILFQRARQLARDGRTLLFTTHVPADVRHLATRIVLLRNGRIESDAAGAFELRRYERMLERDMWGDDHDKPIFGRAANDCDGDDDRVRVARAVAGAAAARSR
jgi:ABC-type multidrug transport system ATPase subunit